MSVMQSNLPYTPDALEPHISETSVSLGYQRYHRLAVDTLNARIADSAYADKSLEQIIDRALGITDDAVLEDACEAWNYSFSWQCMKPFGGGEPSGMLAALIIHRFGSVVEFRLKFIAEASRRAGKGWLWLAWSPDGLNILHTEDGESLACTEYVPLLVLNLSRYAFAHDFRGRPSRYAETFLDRAVNWDVATTMLDNGLQLKAA